MEQHYTMEDVLQFTVDILNQILVPGAYMKDIGMPIMNAVDNLKTLQAAMSEAKKSMEVAEDGTGDGIQD